MLRINQLKLRIDHDKDAIIHKLCNMLHIQASDITYLDILRQSIDARKKPDLFFIYTLDVKVKDENRVLRFVSKKKELKDSITRSNTVNYTFPEGVKDKNKKSPIIIGTGPAGLFCGYYLALNGYKPIIFERGRDVDNRTRDVEGFWSGQPLNEESNVSFGEGGAGTFSDGKLNTLVKDKSGRNREVLRTFIKFGAKESILYEAKPHIGTDVLKDIVKNIRNKIIELGGQVHFESRMTDIIIENDHVRGVIINNSCKYECDELVLAIGHSARDTFKMLYENNIFMEQKAFAVGFRVEHPQKLINTSQYGFEDSGVLGAAPYKVTAKTDYDRGVYSFCMCPGGYVVNASSQDGYTAVNGMSYSDRDGCNANSAIIVSVGPKDFGNTHPLAGIEFQKKIEKNAYIAGNGKVPVQRYGNFKAVIERRNTKIIESELMPAIKGEYQWTDLSGILPDECNRAFIQGMKVFGHQIPGFDDDSVIMSGVESRTSSPVRIVRDEGLQSNVKGIYPCGEGAGYAGGITSAAMDGLRVAEMIVS